MAARRLWTKEETMKWVSLYARPEVWRNRHTHYKGEKRDVLVFNRRCLEHYFDWSAAKNKQPLEIHWLYGAAYAVLRNTKGNLFVWGPSRAMAPHSWGFHITHNDASRTTVGRTPLDKWSARHRDFWIHTTLTTERKPCPRWDSNPQSQQPSGRRPTRCHWDRHN